jgi:lysozyme
MPTITNLKQQLIRDEGLLLRAYKDAEGLWTIGVGHCLIGMSNAQCAELRWSEADALAQLDKDIARANTLMLSYLVWLPAKLDPVRQGAIQNMWFNIGARVMDFYNMLDCLQHQDWSGAASAMQHSLWAKQVGARASRLAEQVRTGTWQ